MPCCSWLVIDDEAIRPRWSPGARSNWKRRRTSAGADRRGSPRTLRAPPYRWRVSTRGRHVGSERFSARWSRRPPLNGQPWTRVLRSVCSPRKTRRETGHSNPCWRKPDRRLRRRLPGVRERDRSLPERGRRRRSQDRAASWLRGARHADAGAVPAGVGGLTPPAATRSVWPASGNSGPSPSVEAPPSGGVFFSAICDTLMR